MSTPEEREMADRFDAVEREHRRYNNLLQQINRANENTMTLLTRDVRRYITHPEVNPVYAESLIAALQRRAWGVLDVLSRDNKQAPLYVAMKTREISKVMLAVSDAWATMEHNGPNEV